jgi:hypothetical protein
MVVGGNTVLTRPFCSILGVLLAASTACAAQFSIFPDRKDLRSPDGRFVVHSVEQVNQSTDFTGVFRSLVLEDTTTGQSRNLYDYVGRVAVAWSGDRFLIVTDYASKKTARALVFRVDQPGEMVALNKTTLGLRVPEKFRAHLEGNDHVYVEVSRIEKDTLFLNVWGYGTLDAHGFRFVCSMDLSDGTLRCEQRVGGGR